MGSQFWIPQCLDGRIGWEKFNRLYPLFLDGKNPWVSGEDFPNQSSDGPKNQNPVMVLKINI